MDAAWIDPSGKPWMFSGISGYPVYWYPDPAHPLARLHRSLVQRLPREQVDILNATDDLATAVVRISSGARPPMFLVVDVKTGNSITGMRAYPKLRGRRLSPVDAIEFTARDGLDIRGYLTTPLDETGERRHDAPLLVISHDGPSAEFPDYRFTADSRYEYERQLFASRGYAVLQVNARGTGGRGQAFQRAGDGEWGRAVQDDFADAVRWAIRKGVTSAGRACFYGTGFGAYSALMAAAREPELFKCVIGVSGIYDLPRLAQGTSGEKSRDLATFLPMSKDSACFEMDTGIAKDIVQARSVSRLSQRKAIDAINAGVNASGEMPLLLRRAIGQDPRELKVRSPVSQASSIKAKVLLVQQYHDAKWTEVQLTAMRRALGSAGNPAKLDTIGDEDGGRNEGYFTPQTRADAYKGFLEFLDRHIGH
jgi:dipeptidyl aminopeptidase/acylaminoacyl peptidase